MKRTLVAGAVLIALMLAGCTATSGQEPSAASTSRQTGSQPDVGSDVFAPAVPAPDAAGAAGDKSISSGTVIGARDVITIGSVSLTVKDPLRSAEDAVKVAQRAGGRIDSRTENPATPNQPASATLALRIPSDALDRSLIELRKLGRVNFVSLNASDVTQQTQDLDARITSLRTSVDRLLGLMTSAATTADVIAVETALAERQSELESLQSQRESLSDQIDFSTVMLELFAEGTIAGGTPGDFWSGIVTGWNALVAALAGLVVGLGVALPWILALAVLAGIVLLVIRLSTRKRKAA
jgi:outer membrane lipoprotein SlyB